MREYTFEVETTGKCEVIVQAENDQEATKKFFNRDIVAKDQTESNIEWPNAHEDNHSELMDYCQGWDNCVEKEKTIDDMAEEKLTIPTKVMVEAPLVVPEIGFKVNINGKNIFIKSLEMCYQDLIIEAKGKYDNNETYTVTYKHTQRHTDLGFELEGSIKNNVFLKLNDGLVVNVQII